MANSYTVRLIDCAGSSGGVDTNTAAVGASLTAWFRSVCQQATSGNTTWTADVQWQAQPGGNSAGQDAGNPLIINLIIYYVQSPRESVIKLHPQYRSTTLPAESDTGIWGTTVSRWTPQGAAVGGLYADTRHQRGLCCALPRHCQRHHAVEPRADGLPREHAQPTDPGRR